MDAARFVLYTPQVRFIMRMGTASLTSAFCTLHLCSLQFVQLRPRGCSLSNWVYVCVSVCIFKTFFLQRPNFVYSVLKGGRF